MTSVIGYPALSAPLPHEIGLEDFVLISSGVTDAIGTSSPEETPNDNKIINAAYSLCRAITS